MLDPPMATYDLLEKKDGYERSGVQGYWIVDPENKEVKGYFLEDELCGKPPTDKGIILSRLLNDDFRL